MIYYFDNCATTRVDDDVLTVMNKYQTEKYFNPSARTSASAEISKEVNAARAKIASLLGASSDEIFFTSGGTEGDNAAIFGAVRNKRGNVVVTSAEHAAVHNPMLQLQNRGVEVRFAKTNSDGSINTGDFLSRIDSETILAAFMHVNNETGAVNDVKYLAKMVKKINQAAVTFSDGVQAVGKVPVNLHSLGVDLYTASGHKLHCTKGIGLLYVKKGCRINPLVWGGGQESGMRSGTEFVAGCVGLSLAVEKAVANLPENTENFLKYKQILTNKLSELPDWKQNCPDNASPAILSLSFAGIKSEVLLRMLEDDGVIVGTGSACSSKNRTSRIADAISLESKYREGILRISFSKYNTEEQANYLADKLLGAVKALRKTIGGAK